MLSACLLSTFLAQRRVSINKPCGTLSTARRVFHSLLSFRAKPSQRSIRVAIWHGTRIGCIHCVYIGRDACCTTRREYFAFTIERRFDDYYGFEISILMFFTCNKIDSSVVMYLILFLIQLLWIVFFFKYERIVINTYDLTCSVFNKLKRNGLRFNLILKNWLEVILKNFENYTSFFLLI